MSENNDPAVLKNKVKRAVFLADKIVEFDDKGRQAADEMKRLLHDLAPFVSVVPLIVRLGKKTFSVSKSATVNVAEPVDIREVTILR